jgi:hypothetical protein
VGAVTEAEKPSAGDNRSTLQGYLDCTEKYIAYASVFYESFGIRENRGVFWWALHKLLDDPAKALPFKELRIFLATAPRTPYSRHMARGALIKMQEMGYVTLANQGVSAKLKLGQIKDKTTTKLEEQFFQAIAAHASKFKKAVSGRRPVTVADLELYVKANQFYRGPYYAEWEKFLSRIGERGQELGGASALQIEQTLIGYSPYWIIINFLWAQYLKSLTKDQSRSLRFDDISHEVNRITFVTRSDLRKALQYLHKKAKLVDITLSGGRPLYGISSEFYDPCLEFNRAGAAILDEFLESLGPKSKGEQ